MVEVALGSSDDVLVMGDINLDLLGDSNVVIDFKDSVSLLEVHNLVSEPTRLSSTSATLIDVILSSKPQLYSKSRSLSTDSDSISDHNLVAAIRLYDGDKRKPDLKIFRDMKKFNKEEFVSDLFKVPWSLVQIFDEVNDMWSTWKKLFMDVVNSHAPIKKKKRRRQKHNLPWMNQQIIILMREQRDYFH